MRNRLASYSRAVLPGKEKEMIFIIKGMKYDTDKMEKVADVKSGTE